MSKKVTCPECSHEFEVPKPAYEAPGDRGDLRVDEHYAHSAHRMQRGRMTGKGIAIRLLGLIAFLGATVAIIVVAQRTGDNPPTAASDPEGQQDTSPHDSVTPAGRLSNADLRRLLDATVVRIEAGGPAGFTDFGAGFVVDEGGLVATNYHVVANSTKARVRLRNRSSYDVEGYAAVSPEDDLAILKLVDPPANLQALPLQADTEPEPQTAVLAVGHPHGVAFSTFDGRVSQVLDTTKLPKSSQRFLELHMKSNEVHQWIQHTAGLSEGNSGGPLVNMQGEAVGINTWVDKQSNYGYALHAMYVEQLLSQPFIKVAPLARYASKEARTEEGFHRLSLARVQELFEKVKALQWRPKDRDDYDVFQQLAWAVTVARFPNSLGLGVDETLVDQLIKQMDEVEAHLNDHKQTAFENITVTNELAQDAVRTASAGVFCFGTVEMQCSGEDGSKGILVKLDGFDETLFIPLDGVLTYPRVGTHLLIVGVNQNGNRLQYGEDPLRQRSAHVIISRTLIPLAD